MAGQQSPWLSLTPEQKQNLEKLGKDAVASNQTFEIPASVIADISKKAQGASQPPRINDATNLPVKSVTMTQKFADPNSKPIKVGEHVQPLIDQWGEASQRANQITSEGIDDL